jgi:hypothetical protein
MARRKNVPARVQAERLQVVRSPRVKAFRNLLKRLHRAPPTGPLTTSETADAEELRQETLAKDDERTKREQREAGGESDFSSE